MKPDAPLINARKALLTPSLALLPRKPRLARGRAGEGPWAGHPAGAQLATLMRASFFATVASPMPRTFVRS